MAPKPPDAFLSYTRVDDQHDGGAISQFRVRLASAVRAVSGEPFEIFQDVDGIGIGEHWPGKLDQMWSEARFFIPIMTPSYFKSEPCREELEKFLRAESERGRNDLILPIYYIECEVLEDEELRAADPLANILHERQRQDWRDLRFEKFESREVRVAIEKLARQIVRARRRVMPEVAEPVPPSPPVAAEEVDVILAEAGDRTFRVIWAVSVITGGDIEEARYLVEHAPQRISSGISPKHAQNIKKQLEGAGATVWVQLGESMVSQLKPSTVFRDVDAEWCPEMVVIPPGEFLMGSTEAERQWAVERGARREWVEWEKPPHRVRIASPLAVARYPVTFDEYDRFGTTLWGVPDEGWGRGRRPVVNVSWDDAKKYVEWLASKTGRPYRLLSEAEWEYACRAGTTTRYGWGDEITSEHANYGENVGKTSEVGSYPANPFGLHDMHGNVWSGSRTAGTTAIGARRTTVAPGPPATVVRGCFAEAAGAVIKQASALQAAPERLPIFGREKSASGSPGRFRDARLRDCGGHGGFGAEVREAG